MLLLVDLDGVVYRGSAPVPGVPALLDRCAAQGDTIVYVTNNSRWHRDEYLARLDAMGVPVRSDLIVTAARATALALAADDGEPSTVMISGGPGLARELRDVGLRVVAPTAKGLAASPSVVVVGVDFALTYRRLSVAADAIRQGARFIATNRDPVYPAADGLWAGAGSMVAAIATASGREPDLVIGKPEPGLFQTAALSVGWPPERAVVVGDQLATDIVAAHRVGARSVLMLTGVTTRAQADAATADQRPDAIAADASELEAVLARYRPESTRASR
ncbi:MAG: HAD-IIA family hydrolase [Chloroflexi bacterium]|nr:HAD-IIA family hydrolase [Chloroflexota bacterium]